MDKDKILENYMNTINLGQNTLGVQAASKRYFGKNVYELNLSECAVIVLYCLDCYGACGAPGKSTYQHAGTGLHQPVRI